MKNDKKAVSIRTKILVPVIILGVVSVFSSITSVISLRSMNQDSSAIVNESMNTITQLSDIELETQKIYQLGLSHIVSTSMTNMVDASVSIKEQEASLEENLTAIYESAGSDKKSDYQALIDDYRHFKGYMSMLVANSANSNNAEAYRLANEQFYPARVRGIRGRRLEV